MTLTDVFFYGCLILFYGTNVFQNIQDRLFPLTPEDCMPPAPKETREQRKQRNREWDEQFPERAEEMRKLTHQVLWIYGIGAFIAFIVIVHGKNL